MKRRPYLYGGALALALAAALGLSTVVTHADTKKPPKLPSFVADGNWPKMPLPSAGDFGTPLVVSTSTGKPKPWSTGEVAGTCIDSQDHVFIVTRGNLVNSPETLDSVPAPRVIEFDRDGNVVNAWGDRNVMPNGIHGCFIGGHPHCITLGRDGLVYVCDRQNDRIQVFNKTGELQRVIPIVPGTGQTLGIGGAPGLGTAGSAWDLAFSNDAMQTYMFEVDGGNEILHIMDRVMGSILTGFGTPGLQAGQFTFLHSVVLDTKGNLYTGETINGRRIQKFTHVECNEGKGAGGGNCS